MYKGNPKETPIIEESSSITEEQRARISQNFRAAKALLARKRPRVDHIVGTPNKRAPLAEISLNANPSTAFKSAEAKLSCSFLSRGVSLCESKLNHGCSCTTKVEKYFNKEYGNALESERAQVNGISGVPFPEESTDMPDLSSTSVSKSVEGGSSTTLCFSVVSTSKSNLTDSDRASNTGVSSEYAAESFRTPMTSFKCSGLRDSPLEPSILDDFFDESIFEDIDAFCEQQSNTKTEVQHSDDGILVSAHNDGIHRTDTNIMSRTLSGDRDPKTDYAAVSCYSSESEVDRVGSDQALQQDEILKTECDFDHEDVSGMIANGIVNNGSLQGDSMPEEYSKYLQSLNDRQREAACCEISVPLMIVAGPGSGKTSTMVGRILVLLNEGISPSNILAMTFTTAAAAEMRDRIGAVAGKAAAKELMISTFHSFALQLCRTYAEKLDRTQEFLIYGHGQQRRAIIEAIRLLENQKSKDNHKVNDDSSDMTSPQHFKNMSNKWQKFVTKAKASGKTHEEYYAMGDEMGAAILRNYSEILRSCNALDYHDLISCAVKLLVDFPEVFEENRVLWKAIVVDEFQDTSSMQYSLLRALASHKCITIIGDDDQSIFSFNGANISGFDSFRKDFPNYKEVRLNKNYRSTRCIVEAASCVIKNNMKRCQLKSVLTDNTFGAKITIKECHNEGAQCAFIVDKILEATSNGSNDKSSHGDIAILYRRQVSGKVFQVAFRERKIPFNLHGVAFYRKKVVKAIIAMLQTTLPNCSDVSHRQVFKALLPFDKEDRKRVIAHIEKVAAMRKCSFICAASDIFSAKISGTFKRGQLTQGRKVLSTLEIISRLVNREQSISAVITSVANMVPQKYLLEQRAVVNVDGGKLLNEDHDLRSVLQYLLDDVSEFLSTQHVANEGETDVGKGNGCVTVLKHFIDYITERERENFLSRRHDNKNSVTLTTIHQSKGLEWDIVFIVKANESEIPLLHESDGIVKETANSLEEERRLFYVAMTRARKKLFILYVTMDNNWQMLPVSRFLREIPDHLREVQAEITVQDIEEKHLFSKETCPPKDKQLSEEENENRGFLCDQTEKACEELAGLVDLSNGTDFIRRFSTEDRLVVSQLFHQWGKKQAFKDPKRLLAKVGFVIEERLRNTKNKNKDVLRSLKSCLGCDEAFQYAEYVLRWLRIPAEKRAHIMREKQEHFQKLRVENSMGSSAPTSKQITYLQSLGCTITPTSRLHASRLIEQYKSL